MKTNENEMKQVLCANIYLKGACGAKSIGAHFIKWKCYDGRLQYGLTLTAEQRNTDGVNASVSVAIDRKSADRLRRFLVDVLDDACDCVDG